MIKLENLDDQLWNEFGHYLMFLLWTKIGTQLEDEFKKEIEHYLKFQLEDQFELSTLLKKEPNTIKLL